ncbi:MAG: hypothetical protein AAGF96_01880 [Bacteroidota bacterium]
MILENRRFTFFKEVGILLLILVNCLILPLHLLFDENSSTIYLFGNKIGHSYLSNQAYAWFTICQLQILIYALLCFYFSKRKYKYALLALIYWMVYALIFDLYIESEDDFILIIQCFSIIITVGVMFLVSGRKIQRCTSYGQGVKTRKHRLDGIIAVPLIFLPFVERLIYRFPEEMNEINILGTTLSSYGFPNITALLDYLLLKLFLIVPVLLLFLEIRKWWRFALLVPILLTVFQMKTAFNPNMEFLDTFEILDAAPLLTLVVVLLLFLSNTAYYQSKIKQMYQRTYDRLELVIQKRFGQREAFLTKTKSKWEAMQKEPKLNDAELLQLKQQLEQEIQKQP